MPTQPSHTPMGNNMKIEGLEEVKALREKLDIARDNYDRKSEWGYPAREAREQLDAEKAYSEILGRFPEARAWMKIDGYSYAANFMKSGAASDAMKKVEAGILPSIAAAEMEKQWSEAAEKAVANS